MRRTASFRLVDDEGRPQQGRTGRVLLSSGRELRFRTGADGRFFVGELEEGTTYDLVLDDD